LAPGQGNRTTQVPESYLAATGQQVLVFEAATGRGIDEAFDRRLGDALRGSAELFGTRFLSMPAG